MTIGNTVKIICEFEDFEGLRVPAENIKLSIYSLQNKLLEEIIITEEENQGNNTYAVYWIPTVTQARAVLEGVVDGLPSKAKDIMLD